MQSYTKSHPPALGLLLLGAEFGGSLSLSDEAGGGGGGRWETGATEATDCGGGICFFPEGGGAAAWDDCWGRCFLTNG